MTIHIQPEDIWEYFHRNKKSLGEKYALVAEDHENGVEIYVTEEGGMPYFRVEVTGAVEAEADSVSKANAESNYKELLNMFISEYGDGVFSGDELERLDEIHSAAEDFLGVLVNEEGVEFSEEDVDYIVAVVEGTLSEEFGIAVYHPTAVEDENGNIKIENVAF